MSDVTELDSRFGEPTQTVLPPTPKPGQATQIEQARAIAEVRAAVMIAMDRPRDRSAALSEMREVCGIMGLAERAFFRVPRGGEQVNGESIHLARELARIWGNIDYGVKELVRDDMRGQSELLAFAWDLQTNARNEIVFIVPHVKGKANRKLTGTQEIYENNASFAGRRLRETIFAVLPIWFKDEAAQLCHKTLEGGGGAPLVQRVADMRGAFEAIGITAAQLETKRGRKIADFLAEDIAALGVIYRSIKRNEVTLAEEFPKEGVVTKTDGASKLDAFEQVNESLMASRVRPDHEKERQKEITPEVLLPEHRPDLEASVADLVKTIGTYNKTTLAKLTASKTYLAFIDELNAADRIDLMNRIRDANAAAMMRDAPAAGSLA